MAEYSRPATLEDLKTLIRALNELLAGNRSTGERVKRALLVLPDKAAGEIDPAWFEGQDTIRVADEFVVDLMFRACVPLRTVSLEGLLKTKQSYREKDALDRKVIEQALQGRSP